jgi:hypothetical protein
VDKIDQIKTLKGGVSGIDGRKERAKTAVGGAAACDLDQVGWCVAKMVHVEI